MNKMQNKKGKEKEDYTNTTRNEEYFSGVILPDELALAIFNYFDLPTINKARLVSSKWNNLITGEDLQKNARIQHTTKQLEKHNQNYDENFTEEQIQRVDEDNYMPISEKLSYIETKQIVVDYNNSLTEWIMNLPFWNWNFCKGLISLTLAGAFLSGIGTLSLMNQTHDLNDRVLLSLIPLGLLFLAVTCYGAHKGRSCYIDKQQEQIQEAIKDLFELFTPANDVQQKTTSEQTLLLNGDPEAQQYSPIAPKESFSP